MPPRREGVNERVLRAVVYLEDGHTDIEPLRHMGLTSRHLAEVLDLVAWGDTASMETREAVARLFEARAAAEEQAGLSTPIVVVKEDRKISLRKVAALVAAILLVTAAMLAFLVRHR
jgi:hypothetical protein